MQHTYVAVVNRSDFGQQFYGHYAVQKHIIHVTTVTCSRHAADAMLTRVTLTPDARDVDARVAAPPSVPHLAAARHPSVRLLDAFITRSSSSFFTPCCAP